MIYYILKPFIRILFHFYFKKLYFYGEEKIPKDRAVLFAVNHPTAFLDPIFVAAHIGPTTRFLLRGDLFVKPIVIWFLNQIKTIPVFRFRDGYSSLKNNQDTFERCYDLLGKGKNILVLAEGQTKHEKKLRPIQKGTARLLLGAFEKHPKGKYCILPLAVNYTAANELRSEMMNAVGDPILLEDYLDAYKENPRKAVKKITDEITRQLKETVVHIADDADAPFTDHILTYKRNDRNKTLLPYKIRSNQPILEELHITKTINTMDTDDKEKLRQQVEHYQQLLDQNKLTDFGVAQPNYYSFGYNLFFLLGLPFWLIGYVSYKIPFGIARSFADKKVKLPAFYGSVILGLSLVIFMIPTLILLLIALFTLSWKLLVGVLLFYAMVYFSVHYKDFYLAQQESKAWKGLTEKEGAELLAARGAVMEWFR